MEHLQTDADRVALAAAGDAAAFEALYLKYDPFLLRQAARFLGPTEMQMRYDAIADVWASLADGGWRLKEKYTEGDGTLFKFLTAMIRFSVLRARERAYRGRPISLDAPSPFSDDDSTALLYRLVAPSTDPLQALIDQEELDALRHAYAALPASDRTLLRWRYADGLTVRECAERVNRNMSTVAERLTRLHQRLADACGVDYIPVRRGRYDRRIAGVSQYGKSSARYRARLAQTESAP